MYPLLRYLERAAIAESVLLQGSENLEREVAWS